MYVCMSYVCLVWPTCLFMSRKAFLDASCACVSEKISKWGSVSEGVCKQNAQRTKIHAQTVWECGMCLRCVALINKSLDISLLPQWLIQVFPWDVARVVACHQRVFVVVLLAHFAFWVTYFVVAFLFLAPLCFPIQIRVHHWGQRNSEREVDIEGEIDK